MLLFMSPAADGEAVGNGCTPEDWIRYGQEMQDAGVWVSGHPLQDLTTCTTVQVGPGGERTITDGPFAETRELFGGYDIIDVPDLDAALEWAARSPGAVGTGSVQVRPIAEIEMPV
ncbi:YciI family protein [Micromonospora sp. M12]